MTDLEILRDYFANFKKQMHDNGYFPRDDREKEWHRGAEFVCVQAVSLIDSLGGDASGKGDIS